MHATCQAWTAARDVRILRIRDGENRFNRAFVDAVHAALDEVAAVEGPVALVTVGEGKFFSLNDKNHTVIAAHKRLLCGVD